MQQKQSFHSLNIAKKVISIQIQSIEKMLGNLGDSFDLAVLEIHKRVAKNKARVVLSGIGKSGLIAQKISATLSSTGVPSFYLHPVEASHGDLGALTTDDIIIVLSHSGESEEILKIIPFIQQNNNFLIAISGNEKSTLAKISDCFLHSAITQEACRHNLTPTSSTTCMLIMGDALAVALIEKNNFTASNFAQFHPSGNLGKRLLTSVKDVMQTNIPRVNLGAKITKVVIEMSKGRAGCVLLFNKANQLAGIITDGDLRRALERDKENFNHLIAADIATIKPLTIAPDTKLEEAKNLMKQKQITCLVIKESEEVVGLVQIFNCEI